jgi:hypothetical protein
MLATPRGTRAAGAFMASRRLWVIVAAVVLWGLALPAPGQPLPTPVTEPGAAGGQEGGEIPILFDDRNVHAVPDLQRRGRVLAALVRHGEIYLPLRTMFERMGATVSASGDGKTITIANRSGQSAVVVVGRREIVLNGESRRLDVPPIVYKGTVLVPVRVLSEAMGAYVFWVPGRRIVVVRYLAQQPAPTPPPPAPATAAPAVPPTTATALATPSPSATALAFIAGAYAAFKNYNEYSEGNRCPEYLFSAAYALERSRLAFKFDFRQDQYLTSADARDALGNHYTVFATIDHGSSFTHEFLARQSTLETRAEYRVADPDVYLGAGYVRAGNNYGNPELTGVGFGLEKLPSLRGPIDFLGSVFYYPSTSGNYTVGNPLSSHYGETYNERYRVLSYDIGLALVLRHVAPYLYAGYAGVHYAAGSNAPAGQTHDGPYVGLGLKL